MILLVRIGIINQRCQVSIPKKIRVGYSLGLSTALAVPSKTVMEIKSFMESKPFMEAKSSMEGEGHCLVGCY